MTPRASTQQPSVELLAGRHCLDFANTLRGRTTDAPFDHLGTYADLVRWSRLARELTGSEASELLERAGRRPDEASEILRRAVDLREALYRIFAAVAVEAPLREADLKLFDAELARAGSRLRLVVRDGGRERRFGLGWSNAPSMDRPLWPVVWSAVELLKMEDLSRVRVCKAETCTWLFLDETRNRSRRWCDMAVCGNRAKVRRHRHRKKQG